MSSAGNEKKPEYIEREAVEKYIKNYGKGAISDGMKTLDPVDDIICLAKGVDLIPTVANVEKVVHCKKCKHRTKSGVCEKFRQRYPFYPENDFFCGFGKKKEGADNV